MRAIEAGPERERIVPPRGRGARWIGGLELALWLAGASLLGAVAWTIGDAYLFQRRAEGALERSWSEARTGDVATAAAATPAAATVIAPGTPIARLSIPRLGVAAVVAEGVDDLVLRRALGHLPASARPGEDGNVALAGHRDTFFHALEDVKVGDELRLESGRADDLYRVEWAMVVEPRQVAVTHDAGYPALTLVTCYPFGYVGSAPYRFVIRARRVEPVGARPRTTG